MGEQSRLLHSVKIRQGSLHTCIVALYVKPMIQMLGLCLHSCDLFVGVDEADPRMWVVSGRKRIAVEFFSSVVKVDAF